MPAIVRCGPLRLSHLSDLACTWDLALAPLAGSPWGPHDAFYPWYGRGFNRVNVVSITNINVVNRGGFIAPLAVRGRQPFFSNANLVMTNAHVRGSTVSSAYHIANLDVALAALDTSAVA